MAKVTTEQAGKEFTQLLQRVIHGEEIIITDDGKPVATLVPVQAAAQRKLPMTLEELREFRKNITLGPDLTIEQLIREGRRV